MALAVGLYSNYGIVIIGNYFFSSTDPSWKNMATVLSSVGDSRQLIYPKSRSHCQEGLKPLVSKANLLVFPVISELLHF
jgi:hypothetical protein